MAYSRWSWSDWYIFWLAKGPEVAQMPPGPRKLSEQLTFMLGGHEQYYTFTYQQLKNIDADGLAKLMPAYPADMMEEAMESVEEWLADIAAEYDQA